MKGRHLSISFIATGLLIGGLLISSLRGNAEGDSATVFRIFQIGESLGELEPCGCSGVKSGGMQQMSAWINHLKKDPGPLYMVAGGFNSPQSGRQAELKLQAYRQILDQLGFDYCLKKYPDKGWYKICKIGRTDYKFLLLSLNHNQLPAANKVLEIIETAQPVLILALTRGFGLQANNIVPPGGYLRIFAPVEIQSPLKPIKIDQHTLILTAGNRGRYGGLLKVTLTPDRDLDWNYETITITERYLPDIKVVRIFADYVQKVKQERLLEQEIKKSSPSGFVGSEICGECHEDEYEIWKKTVHAHAFDTLVKEGRQYDPECVPCHVVGYEFAEGFFNPEDSEYLIHVGCENCHGAGAEHSALSNPGYGKTREKATCVECHEHDRSPNFNYEEAQAKIKHW